MAASFVVYIDESGDEGFVFNKHQGSSHWFILSAVITRKSTDLETVKLVDTVRQRLNRNDKNPLHFRKLKHEDRLPFVDEIAKSPLRCISILIHKPSIREQENFTTRFVLYFYAVRYLFERISWLCRDNRLEEGDGTAEIIFSNRGGMSYEELRNYIDVLRSKPNVSVDWSVIKNNLITAYPHEKRMGLQIADAVASSFYYSVQTTWQGFTEPRYVKILKPVVYNLGKKHRNYGVKVWPSEAESLINTDLIYEDFKGIYS